MKKFLIIVLFLLFFNSIGFAVAANPNIIKEKQPDGTDIEIRLCGDEFYSWYEDGDGYTIVKDTQTKEWTYAQKNSFGDLEPSPKIVGKIIPSKFNMAKSLKDDNRFSKAKQKRVQFNDTLQKSLSLFEKSNDFNLSNQVQYNNNDDTEIKTNFVLLIEFSDLKFNDNPPFKNSSPEEIIQGFNDLFNMEGYNKDGAVGSVKDYFYEISYHKIKYKSVISPIIRLDESYKEYSWTQGDTIALSKVKKMIRNALKKADSDIDFKKIWPDSNKPEGFSVIHAGGGAESGNKDFIWSHKSSIEPITLDGITFSDYHIEPAGRGTNGNEGLVRIGVICHESLHFFGLPDLYDTTYLTAGLGKFCIMAFGEWNGNQGNRPAHPCAWAKYYLGWIKPKIINEEGLNSIGESATDKEAFYIFKPSGFDLNEYFLMENRQSVGFDKGLPGTKRGILIYHVDERQKDNDLIYNDNYLVQLEEAGSGTSNWRRFPLIKNNSFSGSDSDYFRNSSVSYFGDNCISSPNSKSYNGLSSGIKISEISSSSSLMTFMYGKDIIIIDDLSNIVCYPNPTRKGVVNIINLPTNLQDFSVEIFTLTSKLVKSFSSDDTEYTNDGFRKIKWNCKNESGEDVAPGVYFVLVKNNSKKKVFKVAVIR